MRPAQLIGLLLWRAGLLLVTAWVFFTACRYLVRLVDVPLQIEIGLGLLLAGGALVVVSLVLERVQDLRREGDLSD